MLSPVLLDVTQKSHVDDLIRKLTAQQTEGKIVIHGIVHNAAVISTGVRHTYIHPHTHSHMHIHIHTYIHRAIGGTT